MRGTSLALLAFQAATSVVAGPSGVMDRGLSDLERHDKRQTHALGPGMGIAKLIIAIKDYLKNENAYDPSVPNKCNLLLSTTDGAHCTACLLCANTDDYRQCRSAKVIPGPGPGWNVCYLKGEQFLNHPDIGDFSVTFTKAGGVDGDNTDGLHTPIVKFANLANWEPWDIQKIIDDQGGKDTGNLCHRKDNSPNHYLGWECGIPKIGGGAAFGIQLQEPDSDQGGFKGGWCTAHIVQYQRNEFGIGDKFEFDVTLFDGEKKQVGHVSHLKVDGNGKASMTSRLPYTIEIESGGGDNDFVTIAYADQKWTCDDGDGGAHGCTLGNGKEHGYENGNREGDFGFSC